MLNRPTHKTLPRSATTIQKLHRVLALVVLMWLQYIFSVQCFVFNVLLSESHFQCGQLLQDQEPVQRWHVSCSQVYQQAKMVRMQH